MAPFELVVPATEDEALAGGPAGRVAALAGGTDLLLDIDRRRLAPELLVSLRLLPWNTHRWDGEHLVIGSTEPLARLEADPELAARMPALAQAIAAVGSAPLREQATLGGNLGRAAPASDLVPVLLALDADVELASGRIEEAFDRLLGVIRRTSGEDREQARAHLVGLFDILPPRDPRVNRARSTLSALLF